MISVLCIIGSYALRNNLFDVGAMLESNLRRSLLMSGGSFSIFFPRPISVAFLILAVVSLLWPLLRKKMEADTGAKAE